MEWTTQKPGVPCLFMSATMQNLQWYYEVWELVRCGEGDEDDFENGLVLLDNRGNSMYFGVSKINADKYLILPKHE